MKGSLPSPFTIFPQEIIASLDKDFWNYNNSGFCYTEVSHRSQHYAQINQASMDMVRTYFNVPPNYKIIYLPGQCGHASIAFNLCKTTNNQAIYIVTDRQSEHAFQEGLKVNPKAVKVGSFQERKNIFKKQPHESNSYYTFYSKVGFEDGRVSGQPEGEDGQVLVCSLNGCSYFQEVDVSKHGLVLIETGRGIGLAGASIIIVRQDLTEDHLPTCPDLMDYKMMLGMKSIVNTPFTFVPLLLHRHLQYLLQKGLTIAQVKRQLKVIKQEYKEELEKWTEVIDTESVGLIKFKVPPQGQRQDIEEYAVLQGDYALIMLQLENKGESRAFVQQLFK